MWTEKIATAEAGNVPYGAILWASIAQALGVLGYGAIQRKWPENVDLAKWAPTLVGAAGAVLVPQTKKVIGEATAKSLAIGLGNIALAPWIGRGLNMIFYPTPPVTAGRRQMPQRKIAGHPNPNPSRGTDLNGQQAANDLDATVH